MADNKNDILLKLKIQTDKANAALKKTEVQIKKTIQSFKGLTKGSLQYQEAQAKLASQQATYAQQSEKYNNSLRVQTAAQASATKQTNKLASASGGATTSVLELGRIVSDAPYGIRGMANNISQLASNMLFTSQQVDATSGKIIGFSGVLKQMGKTFMGPLGLLFLIQGAIALLDGFAGGATKAKESTQDLTKEVYANAIVMSGYVDELEDVNISEERRKVVVQELTKTIPTLTAADLEYGKNLDNVRLKIKQYTLAQASRIEMDKLVQENSELLSQQMKVDLINSTEDQKEKIRLIKGLFVDAGVETEKLVQQSYSMGQKSMTLRDKTNQELIRDFKELAKGIKEESDPIMKRIERLSQGLAFDPSKSKNGKKKKRAKVEYFDFKSLEEGRGKIIAEIMKTDEKIALLSAKDKKSRLIIQRDFHLRRLMAVDGANSELITKYKDYYNKLIQTAEDGELELLAKESAKGMGGAPRDKNKDALNILSARLEKLQDFANKFNEMSSFATSFMDSEYQRQSVIEQNKTNSLNNELKERLNNENLSAEERKNIQLKIARNDENLRKRQEEIEKKRFKLNKAANIANALVSTYAGASKAYYNTLADPKNILAPQQALLRAKINAGIATALGLANVAMIARQKFQSSAGAAPTAGALGGGSGGGEGESREFNFNLAGSTQSNQLTQSIASQLSQPIQTYVVSSEITSQQQLDLNISNTATIG